MISNDDKTTETINKKDEQGGFVAVLHSLEQQFYGPETNNLTASAFKVLLYIRHRALRDWTKRKQIPKEEIMKATGLKRTALKDALRELEKEEFLQVTKIKVGKVWQDNMYELHPKRFGEEYIYRPDKPSFQVIYGSKGHESNSDRPRSELRPRGRSELRPRVGRESDLGNEPNPIESLDNSALKNPLKEPIKKTLSEEVDKFASKWTENREMTSEEIERKKQFLRKQSLEVSK